VKKMAFIALNNFSMDNNNEFLSKGKTLEILNSLREELFQAMKEHLYGSRDAIDKINTLKKRVQEVNHYYTLLHT